MATEIQEAGPDSPPGYESYPVQDTKDKEGVVRTDAVDVEGSLDNESKEFLKDRAEATELTPAEAFKWNVDGDQSPCKFWSLRTSWSITVLT